MSFKTSLTALLLASVVQPIQPGVQKYTDGPPSLRKTFQGPKPLHSVINRPHHNVPRAVIESRQHGSFDC